MNEKFAFFEQVAQALGDGWIFDRIRTKQVGSFCEYVLKKERCFLHIRESGGKWNVYTFPDVATRDVYWLKCPKVVNISQQKSAETVARDLMRRMIPDALAYAKALREAMDERQKRQEEKAQKIHLLRMALQKSGSEMPAHCGQGVYVESTSAHSGGTFKMQSDSVMIDLRYVDYELALKIAQVIGAH